MKRITWWPQLWLGLNFNWGLLVGYYSSVSDIKFNITIILFYTGSIFWTIAYDTIYGFQDIEDDIKIGVKSTSIKFRKNPKVFLIFNYFTCYVFWFASLSILTIQPLILFFLSVLFIPLISNILKMSLDDPLSCERSFKNNSLFGFFTTILLISFNIFR
jgi:4-hydroxybenzoate polyprenyltransferase